MERCEPCDVVVRTKVDLELVKRQVEDVRLVVVRRCNLVPANAKDDSTLEIQSKVGRRHEGVIFASKEVVDASTIGLIGHADSRAVPDKRCLGLDAGECVVTLV